MKALSMLQPWGSLFLTPEKQWETRSRRIHHRGWMAIHTSQALTPRLRALCATHPFARALRATLDIAGPAQLPLGAVIGVVRVIGCIEAERVIGGNAVILPRGMDEAAFGDFTRGRFAWQRAPRVYRLPNPVPCKGAMSLWDLPRAVESAVVDQLRRMTGNGELPVDGRVPPPAERTAGEQAT